MPEEIDQLKARIKALEDEVSLLVGWLLAEQQVNEAATREVALRDALERYRTAKQALTEHGLRCDECSVKEAASQCQVCRGAGQTLVSYATSEYAKPCPNGCTNHWATHNAQLQEDLKTADRSIEVVLADPSSAAGRIGAVLWTAQAFWEVAKAGGPSDKYFKARNELFEAVRGLLERPTNSLKEVKQA